MHQARGIYTLKDPHDKIIVVLAAGERSGKDFVEKVHRGRDL